MSINRQFNQKQSTLNEEWVYNRESAQNPNNKWKWYAASLKEIKLPFLLLGGTISCYKVNERHMNSFELRRNYRARQHGSIRLPPRSLASSRGRTLAIRMGALVNKKTFERGAYWRWVESLRYLLLSILTLRLLLFVMRFIKSILGYWVVCGTVHFCCYYFLDEINGIIYNPMDLVNSKLDN